MEKRESTLRWGLCGKRARVAWGIDHRTFEAHPLQHGVGRVGVLACAGNERKVRGVVWESNGEVRGGSHTEGQNALVDKQHGAVRHA